MNEPPSLLRGMDGPCWPPLERGFLAMPFVLANVAENRVGAEMRRFYVTAFGLWFCVARGWVFDPGDALPLSSRAAEVVKEAQPGVTVVEVSA